MVKFGRLAKCKELVFWQGSRLLFGVVNTTEDTKKLALLM